MASTPVLPRVWTTFRAFAVAVVPASERLDKDGWSRLRAIVEDALSSRSVSVRRQLVLFLRLADVAALVRHGRLLRSLPPERARRFLASLERAPLLAVRRGVWGVRTLAFMGYYGQRGIGAELGYRAVREGWDVRGGSAGPWTERGAAAGPEPVVLNLLQRSDHDA